MIGKKHHLTAEGLRRMREEFNTLLRFRMERVREEENPDELALIEKRLGELEVALQSYELITPPPPEGRDRVSLGATVTVSAGGKNHVFTIVGSLEANPVLGKISNESPVGRALMGRRVGEVVLVHARSDIAYTVASISYDV